MQNSKSFFQNAKSNSIESQLYKTEYTSILSEITIKEYEDSIPQERRIKQGIISGQTYNKYLTTFCGDLGFNIPHQAISSFITKFMHMSETNNTYKDGHILSRFESLGIYTDSKILIVDYLVSKSNSTIDKEFSINKVSITGDFDKLIELYMSY